jgi:uroporphyrinogen decarboxylase
MTEMRPRERIRKALNHQEPDRVPLILGGCTSTSISVQAYQRLKKYLRLNHDAVTYMSFALQIVEIEETVFKAFEIDIRPVAEKAPSEASSYDSQNDALTDEWGTTWKRPEGSLYYDIVDPPLRDATIEDLDKYAWPDPDHPERNDGVLQRAKDLHENSPYAVYGNVPGNNIFERSWFLRGYEQFLMDLAIDKGFAHALLSHITNIQKRRTANFLSQCGKYLDIIRTGDDLATQTTVQIAPSLYREMIKPYHREYFQLIREYTDAKIMFHCCGAIYPLIPDLIEIGVDILNPVQVSCEQMDTKKLKEEFGDQLSFCGAIDTQHVLPYGSVADVRAEVRQRIADLGIGGGYLLASVHNIQADVPPENIATMFTAGAEYGEYPLKKIH